MFLSMYLLNNYGMNITNIAGVGKYIGFMTFMVSMFMPFQGVFINSQCTTQANLLR